MNREEVIAFVGENREFFLATTEDGDPRVRGMSVFLVDDSGLYVCTGKSKDVYRQLQANPSVELCFFGAEQMVQLRLRGTLEERDDLELKKKAVEKFPFLKPFTEQYGYEILAIFRLAMGKSSMWTMALEEAGKSVEYLPF